MRRIVAILSAAALFSCPLVSFASAPAGSPIIVTPSDDAVLYTCNGCNPNPVHEALITAGYIQAAIRFPTSAITGPIDKAFLTVADHTESGDRDVGIYGIATGGASVTHDDGNAGVFLGYMHLPSDFDTGRDDATFDVTSFLSQIRNPYVGFNLRTAGLGGFSSIFYNAGHASQLHVTFAAISEPSSSCVFAPLAFAAGAIRRRPTSHKRV